MSLTAYFLRTAIHNLRRGGQRVLVAMLCIAFGVMSLVAMTMLSDSIARMLVIEPAHLVGADISMQPLAEDIILPEHEAGLKDLQANREIDRYTLVGFTSTLTFHLSDSGELYFPQAGIGIDPANYPLVGTLALRDPGNTGLSTLLQETGDVLITKDLAAEFQLEPGDELVLADSTVGISVPARVRGIVVDTPNHQGSKLYYNHATAEALAGSPRMLNTALVTSPDPYALRDHLTEQGWSVFLAEQLTWNEKAVQGMFELALKGSGILGMLVGGIGIANTMQVLLRRRRKEVAIWKTLGYREGELQLLFAVEAALLGTIGSLLGAGVGAAVSFGLVGLFSRTTTLLISWVFSPMILVNGVLVGIATSVIFSLLAIVSASHVSPLALLRNETLSADRLPRRRIAGLALLLAIPFTAVTSLVMGSLLNGVGVLLVALIGLLLMGGMFWFIVWAVTRLLPLRGLPLAHMSRNNLRRRGLGLVFAMVALFVGVVALALSAVVTQNAQRAMEMFAVKVNGSNIQVMAKADQETVIRDVIAAQAVSQVRVSDGYQATVRGITLTGQENAHISPLLIGRSDPSDLLIEGAVWGSQPDGVYIYRYAEVPTSSQMEIRLWDGQVHTVTVVGTYEFEEMGGMRTAPGLLMSSQRLSQIIPPDTVQFYLQAPAGQVNQLSASLGAALPQTMVINLLAYNARFTQQYQNLFVFAIAMAGLALLAGVLLVANAVSLAMLDRRYELGVLKAMGYSRGHILITLMIEYSLVGLIAAAAGLGAVRAFLWVVGKANELAGSFLVMSPLAALVIGLCAVGLTLLTVLLVTWQPTKVSPSVILNER